LRPDGAPLTFLATSDIHNLLVLSLVTHRLTRPRTRAGRGCLSVPIQKRE
jgi:hypothetical protein